MRHARGVGEEGIDHDREFPPCQRLGDGVRLRQHRHRIGGADPDGPDRGIAGLEDRVAEARLGEEAGSDLLTAGKRQVEGPAALRVVRHPAAGDPDVPRDGPQRVENSDRGRAMPPPLQAPADVERCRTDCIGVGKGDKCLQGHSGELGPRLHAAGVRQGAKKVEVVAVIPGARIGRARLEHPPRHP